MSNTHLQPASFAASLVNNARDPILGTNVTAKICAKPTWEMGRITLTGADAGTWVPDAGFVAALSAEPRNLIVAVKSLDGILTAGDNIVVHFTGTDQTTAALTGPATIVRPDWTNPVAQDYPFGLAASAIPATADKYFKTIASMTFECNTDCTGLELVVFAVPRLTDFEQIPCGTGFTFGKKNRPAVNVPCGPDGAAYVMKGRSVPGTYKVSSTYFGQGMGLDVFDGKRVNLLAEIRKEGGLVTERNLLINAIIQTKPEVGEGDAIGTVTSESNYEFAAVLIAPDA